MQLYFLSFCYRFWDIPSPWWQASTVMVGAGSALSLLVAVTAISACCITYVVHTASARVAGVIQLLAGEWMGIELSRQDQRLSSSCCVLYYILYKHTLLHVRVKSVRYPLT